MNIIINNDVYIFHFIIKLKLFKAINRNYINTENERY